MAKILCSEDEIKRFPSNSFDEFKKEMDDMEEAYRLDEFCQEQVGISCI